MKKILKRVLMVMAAVFIVESTYTVYADDIDYTNESGSEYSENTSDEQSIQKQEDDITKDEEEDTENTENEDSNAANTSNTLNTEEAITKETSEDSVLDDQEDINADESADDEQKNEQPTQQVIDGKKYMVNSDGTHLTGWYHMEPFGDLYLDPNDNGAAVTGIFTIVEDESINTYLFDSNGIVRKTSGTPNVDGKKYWIKENGTLGSGWLYLGNWKMYFDTETYAAKTLDDGIVDIEGQKYLFNSDGIIQAFAGTTIINGAKYWFSEKGYLCQGWLTIGSWTLYFDPETYKGAAGITSIDGNNYLFDGNGILKTSGTPVVNGKKYYIGADNTIRSGWLYLGNWKMYFDPASYTAYTANDGVVDIDGYKYLFNSDGVMQTFAGTTIINGAKYWFSDEGYLKCGWLKLGNCMLYFDPETYQAATGITKIDGINYLFDGNGVKITKKGLIVSNGKKYYIDSNGSTVTGWATIGNWRMYFDESTGVAATGIRTIDGVLCVFNSDGILTSYQGYNSLFESAEDIITVGYNGEMFSSIQEAIDYAKQRNTLNTFGNIKVIILISEGTYQCEINDPTLGQIAFIGIGMPTLVSNLSYPVGCFNTYGDNVFMNLTMKSTGNVYAFHWEGGGNTRNSSSKYGTYFSNCIFNSQNHASVGIGAMSVGTKITFENCTFNGSFADVFFHNSVYGDSYNNDITFLNCQATNTGIIRIDDSARINLDHNSVLNMHFINNEFKGISFYAGTTGKYANKMLSYIPNDSDNIILSNDSYGNSSDVFNK